MKINYGLMAVSPEVKEAGKGTFDDVLHFCFYEEKPTNHDIEVLHNELSTDPEFGLINSDFVIIEATPEICEVFQMVLQEEGIED
jgi:hypothetical protein